MYFNPRDHCKCVFIMYYVFRHLYRFFQTIRSLKSLWIRGFFFIVAVHIKQGGGPRVVVSTAAFHARVRGSVPGLGGLKETKMFLPHPRVKVSIVGSLRDREVACSASDRQGSNFESCVWRTVSSQSSHHPQEVLLAQFSLYVHKGGLKPDSFHFFIYTLNNDVNVVMHYNYSFGIQLVGQSSGNTEWFRFIQRYSKTFTYLCFMSTV